MCVCNWQVAAAGEGYDTGGGTNVCSYVNIHIRVRIL